MHFKILKSKLTLEIRLNQIFSIFKYLLFLKNIGISIFEKIISAFFIYKV